MPVATTDGNMTYAQMKQYKDFLPKQLYIPAAQWVVRDPTLLDPAVAAKHKVSTRPSRTPARKPDIASELAWEPGMIVVDALRKLGTDATAQQIRDVASRPRAIAGVNGIYDFTEGAATRARRLRHGGDALGAGQEPGKSSASRPAFRSTERGP